MGIRGPKKKGDSRRDGEIILIRPSSFENHLQYLIEVWNSEKNDAVEMAIALISSQIKAAHTIVNELNHGAEIKQIEEQYGIKFSAASNTALPEQEGRPEYYGSVFSILYWHGEYTVFLDQDSQ